MAMYDKMPAMYEANNNGSYTYHWGIQEVQIPSGMHSEKNAATTTKWECQEVVVWGTVTKDKLTEKVVTTLWANDYEKKLINDCKAAKEGVFGSITGATAKTYIARYKKFLAQRKAWNNKVDQVAGKGLSSCDYLGHGRYFVQVVKRALVILHCGLQSLFLHKTMSILKFNLRLMVMRQQQVISRISVLQ